MQELRVSFTKVGLYLTTFILFILVVMKIYFLPFTNEEMFFLVSSFLIFLGEMVFFDKIKKYLTGLQIFSYIILIFLIFASYMSLVQFSILLWVYPTILSAFFIMPRFYALLVPFLSLYGLAYLFFKEFLALYDFVNLFISVIVFSIFSYYINKLISDYEEKIEEKNRVLRELSQRDFLTGVYNRRAFFELAKDINPPSVLIMFDIDHFKKINDTYGHDAGDEVLKFFANLVKSHIRKDDIFARIGGEEFVILLEKGDLQSGKKVAEKIRHLVEHSQINGIRFTVSAGVAVYDGNISKNLKEADLALYEAKKKRNRVVVYSKKLQS